MKIYGNVVNFSKALMAQYLRPGMTVIDATCGNGNDTVNMMSCMSYEGIFLAFDIQEYACNQTKALITSNVESLGSSQLKKLDYRVIEASHADMKHYINDNQADFIIFNLGYLPGGDKHVTTQVSSTLKAMAASLDILKSSGLLFVLCYLGHETGKKERHALDDYFENLPQSHYDVSLTSFINQRGEPPILWVIEKK